ncbi:hypothetical protein [Halorussus caseinilyticus]|uniref:Uncharacterized protein n=1 Tax=Halorussus caseinilyticus TaxID=3034025 RepID=A0ABD5WIF0_9EURY
MISLFHGSASDGIRVTLAPPVPSAYAVEECAPDSLTHSTVVPGSTNSPMGSK